MIPRKYDILYPGWTPTKDSAVAAARILNIDFFAWDHVVWNTQTLEEVCKTFQVDQNEATIELTELNQEMGLYD